MHMVYVGVRAGGRRGQAVEAGKAAGTDPAQAAAALKEIAASVQSVCRLLPQSAPLTEAYRALASAVTAGLAAWPANAGPLVEQVPTALRALMDSVRVCLDLSFDVRVPGPPPIHNRHRHVHARTHMGNRAYAVLTGGVRRGGVGCVPGWTGGWE
jgi:hypothetical protein